jgi:signal transduction histidine kinase
MQASRANTLLVGVLVLLGIGLALLATLQFRWIDQVSEAEELRMRASVELAARQLTQDLQSELRGIVDAFAGPPDGDLVLREEEWRRTARYPRLIESVSVDRRFIDRGPPFDPRSLEIVLGDRRGRPEPRPFEGREGRPGPPEDDPLGGRTERPPERLDPPPGPPQVIVIKLDRGELTRVVAELARKHFADAYDVAIVSHEGVFFRTDARWPDGRTPPDVDLPVRLMGPPEQGQRPPRDSPRFGGEDPRRDEGGGWHLLVRRRDGGLARVVASARRRNLAVSAGILLILISAVAILLYLLRRADRLREQQTEFVAAISHELNTPVTALRSAGENLKDGIITDPAKLARYGETIVKESARLGDMIAQVLEFAGMRARRDRGANEPVDIGSVIEEAVAQSRWVIDGDSVRVETNIQPDLPRPLGDSRALTRAVQNLVANAIRHGGSGGWVGVRAYREGNSKIAISVEDRGPGIDSRDAAHLFEPFYRGRGTSAVRGSGLGLTIVQQVVAAHGGAIEVQRRRREGAAFTMTLPLSSHPERHA